MSELVLVAEWLTENNLNLVRNMRLGDSAEGGSISVYFDEKALTQEQLDNLRGIGNWSRHMSYDMLRVTTGERVSFEVILWRDHMMVTERIEGVG